MKNSLKGKNVLITAGPTREYIDPVRYISNDSSGRMGMALAEVARELGARVTLICGQITASLVVGRWPLVKPTTNDKRLTTFANFLHVPVTSTQQMFSAVRKFYKQADIIIMAAAVADFRPAKCCKQKIKKSLAVSRWPLVTPTTNDKRLTTLSLIPSPDILHWLGAHKLPHQILVGFALETENLIKNAKAKLRAKKCDYIVANHAKAIGAKKSGAIVISKNGISRLKMQNKPQLAKHILAKISSFDISKQSDIKPLKNVGF